MIIVDVKQGTPEWHAERVGKPSASCFDKIVTPKGVPSKSAQKYIYQLAGERLTGKKEEGYTNSNMERGIQMESEARSFYEIVNGVEVKEVGFCYPNEDKLYGCSPDGLVGEDGGLEIKCPLISTHIGYMLDNSVLLADYFQQVQGSLLVTDRKWWDLISYYPGLNPVIIRVNRDVAFINELKAQLTLFCRDVEAITKKLKEKQ